ncbi:hypothetical protein [Thioclava sp.]|uniref:hypothetical protein n=1 Tax=Thioclava sp. TaxID=1933450 RepID=UPI003AA8203C
MVAWRGFPSGRPAARQRGRRNDSPAIKEGSFDRLRQRGMRTDESGYGVLEISAAIAQVVGGVLKI